MTVLDNYAPAVFTGNGVTTVFPFSFVVYDENHLRVYERVISTNVRTLISAANYTVTGVPGAGSITYLPGGAPLAATKKLEILREVPYTQDLDIENQGGFYANTIENQLDLTTMQIQQIEEQLGRTIKTELGENLPDEIILGDGVVGAPILLGTTYWEIGKESYEALRARVTANSAGKVPVGGNTGQVLSKNSAADYDTGWESIATEARVELGADNGSPFDGDFAPESHAWRLTTGKTCTVVIAGDSNATPFANALFERDTLWGMLKEKLLEENPGVTFTFINRAIGATTWTNFNNVPNTIPANILWYTNPATPWLDYIKLDEPDLLFLAFGMNDAQNFVAEQLRAVFESKISAWAKIPNIIMCTNLLPTTNTSQDQFDLPISQTGRAYVAGYERSYAKYYGYGVLDFFKANRMLRDGYDPYQTRLEEVLLESATAMPFIHSAEVLDYSASFLFENVGANFWEESGNAIEIRLSLNAGNVVWLGRTGGGNVELTIFKGQQNYQTYSPSAKLIDALDTGVAAPITGDVTITVEIMSTTLRITVNGNTVFDGPVLRYGGLFTPKIGYANDVAVARDVIVTMSVGVPIDKNYNLTSTEIFGPYTGATTVTQKPYGGNGANHPTSLGARAIYGYVLNNISFFSTGYGYNSRVGGTVLLGRGPNVVSALGAASGANPTLIPNSEDVNCGLNFGTLGNGKFNFRTNGNATLQFVVGHTTAAVNQLTVTGGAAGSAPGFTAGGADTNIDVLMTPKGSGLLSLSYAGTLATVPANFSAVHMLPVKFGGTIYYIPGKTSTW